MTAMETLLNQLCEDGPAALQVVFKNGGVMAGALKHHSTIAGVYQLRTVLHRSNTSQADTMDIFFCADEVSNLVVPIERPIIDVMPTLVRPDSR